MPYNTRRKSLSLPSLGIQLPSTSRRSPSLSKTAQPVDDNLPPSKKVKTSHHDSSAASPESSPPTFPKTGLKAHLAGSRRNTLEQTPPPSPAEDGAPAKIDTDGINDDIVVAVIEQLEKTGNRPHLVKELAAALVNLNKSAANSANPAALISSRLSSYLKRPWTALAPCPVAKELVPVHPRKVYYYLTTSRRQPIPELSDDVIIRGGAAQNITPSVSSVDHDEEDALARERARLSPSPEIDFSTPDFEDDHDALAHRSESVGTPGARHNFTDAPRHSRLGDSHRSASPPLEGDEKEFTLTASSVRERASEEKANRLDNQVGTAESSDPMSLGKMQYEDADIMSSPNNDGPLPSSASNNRMADDQFGDYFSHVNYRTQGQDLDEAAVVALFGTSPSPSLSSVTSSLSSGTSAASDVDLDTQQTTLDDADLLKLQNDHRRSFENKIASPSTLKRSIDMSNSGFAEADLRMSDIPDWDGKLSLRMRSIVNVDMDLVPDSWIELKSPETVEVDELDEMFGEI